MNICVVGAGYVGLVAGVGFALYGHRVKCVEAISEKVNLINQGTPPFYEPRLQDELRKTLASGLLTVTTDLSDAVAGSDVIFVCVGTPAKEDGAMDISSLKQAIHQIAVAMESQPQYQVVVIKSTVVPTTTESIILPILKETMSKPFGLSMNPEFLREGNAVEDFLNQDRIVIGALDAKTGEVLEALYKDFQAPIVITSIPTAEMIKHTSNALLATAISFTNDVANICELIPGVDARDVMEAVHLDHRLSPEHNGERIRPGFLSYLLPGCGYGGSCLPKDLRAFQAFAVDKGYQPLLLEAVERINASRSIRLVDMAEHALGSLSNKCIAILGLAFKPQTDDIRESPAIKAVEELLRRGATVQAYDPKAAGNFLHLWSKSEKISCASGALEALTNADAAIVITDWPEFRQIKPQTFVSLMRQPIVVDGRRTLNYPDDVSWRYLGVGRSWG